MTRTGIGGISEPLGSREGKLTMLAIIMMLYVMALFVAIGVHELLGHGLFTVLLGGDFYAVYLSPANGYVSFWLPETMSPSTVAFIYLSGILVQILVGLAVLFLVLPRVRSFMWGLFTLLLCVGLLVHSSLYLVMGYVYEAGDTRYAALVLGAEPDAFLVAGLVLAGTFAILISMHALRFLGRFADLTDDRERNVMLLMFWYPPMLLGGFLSLAMALASSPADNAYQVLNSAMLLLFIGAAVVLVPMFSEPAFEREHRVTMRSVLAVALCFVLLMAGWGGVFGLSRETAHGILIKDPPVEVEYFYSDYTMGNANVHLYENGTVRVELVLRNAMRSPSPLEDRIYHSFDTRPDWERWVARSRNFLVGMFDLPRGVGENLTFATGFAEIAAGNYTDSLGRSCTTYIPLAQMGTRQFWVNPGEQDPEPVEPDITIAFADPWKYQGGYLDRVAVTWDGNLTCIGLEAANISEALVMPTSGGIGQGFASWDNTEPETSPVYYTFKFSIAGRG